MNKRLLIIAVFFAFLGFSQNSMAEKQDSVAVKFASIDVKRVLLSVEEGLITKKNLQEYAKQKKAELETKQNEFEKLRADFQKNAAMLSEAAKKEKQQTIEKKYRELHDAKMSIQNEFKQREMEASEKIFFNIRKVITSLAEKKNFSLVYEKNSTLLYAKDPVDITDEVIKEYDKKHAVKQRKS